MNVPYPPVADYESMPPPQIIPAHMDPSRSEYSDYSVPPHEPHTQNYGLIQPYIPPMKHPVTAPPYMPQQPDHVPYHNRESDRIQLHQKQLYRDIQHPQYYQPMDYRDGYHPQRPLQKQIPQPTGLPYHIPTVSHSVPVPAPPQHVPYYQPIHEGPTPNYEGYYPNNSQAADTPSNAIGIRPMPSRQSNNNAPRPPQQAYGSEGMARGVIPQYPSLGFLTSEESQHGPSDTPQVHQFPSAFHPQAQTLPQQLSLSAASDPRAQQPIPPNTYMPPTSNVPPDLLPQNSQNVDVMSIPQQTFGGDVPRHSYQQAPDFSFSSGLVSTSSGGETSQQVGAAGSWIKSGPIYPGWEDDTKKYTQILEGEKYYWLLDMFNERGFWKSIVPPYCLKRRSEHNDAFLLECLLNCSRRSGSPRIESIIDTQLSLFHKIFVKRNDNSEELKVNSEIEEQTLEMHIHDLLISLCLILLMFQIKLTNELMQLGTYSVTIINNQLKIFGIMSELVCSDTGVYGSPKEGESQNVQLQTNDSSEYSIIRACTVYSVTILKFFLLKYLQANRKLMDFSNIEDRNAAKWTIVYDYASSNLFYLFNLNLFEVKNLKTLYQGFVFNRTQAGQKIDNKSDASKLRELIWKVIRYHYEVLNPEEPTDQAKSTDWVGISLQEPNLDYSIPRSNVLLAGTGIDSARALVSEEGSRLGSSMGKATSLVDDLTKLFNPHRLNGYENDEKAEKPLLPNDRILSMGLLMTYMNSIAASLVDEQPSPSYYKEKIVGVFQALSNSFLESDSALRWERNYSWLLQT